MTEKHYIYGLIDPRTARIRYVGKSVNPPLRYSAHLSEKGDNNKCKWVTELSRLMLKPSMVILDETDFANIFVLEDKWINRAVSLGWELVNTQGVPDNYDCVYQLSSEKYAEISEDRKHVEIPQFPVSGASSYTKGYLLKKLKDNFYRPIFQDGDLVMLTKGKTPGWATMVIIENHGGIPYFRSCEHSISIKTSELPLYAVASLPDCVDSYGGNVKYYAEISTGQHRKYPDWYKRQIVEMEDAAPITGRTFYAALG